MDSPGILVASVGVPHGAIGLFQGSDLVALRNTRFTSQGRYVFSFPCFFCHLNKLEKDINKGTIGFRFLLTLGG